MADASLGRSVALAALAPIAERLADEREREEAKAERRRRLENELEALPSLERTTPPGHWSPWWRTELQEVLLGLLIIGVPALIFGPGLVALVFNLISGSEVVGWIMWVICAFALIYWWVKKEILDVIQRGKEVAEASEAYSRAVKAYDAREAERVAIRAKIEELR
ncbi:MAG: hypothetical protein WB507_03695 [Solirubrobacterales bacterium]